MGQAKLRGTLEQRRQEAIARIDARKEFIREKASHVWAQMTPEEQNERIEIAKLAMETFDNSSTQKSDAKKKPAIKNGVKK